MALLTNITEPTGNFVELQLRATVGNRNAIGARVNVTYSGQMHRSDVVSGDGYFCANEQKLVFGLGMSERIDRLEIVWPDGMREVHLDLPARSRWVAIQASRLISMAP